MSFNEPRIMDQNSRNPSLCMEPSSWIHQNHIVEQRKCAAYVGVSRKTFPPTTHFGIRAFSGLVFFFRPLKTRGKSIGCRRQLYLIEEGS
jgi:hypothetical protein